MKTGPTALPTMTRLVVAGPLVTSLVDETSHVTEILYEIAPRMSHINHTNVKSLEEGSLALSSDHNMILG